MFWRSFRLVERCSLKAEKNEAQHVASADTLLLSVIFSFSEVDCRCGSGCQIVAMMQAAEPGHRYNSVINTGILDCFTTGGRSLRQRNMSSVLVVVPDVLVHQAFQMAFVHNNYIVEQIPAAVADPSLGHAILPRTSEAGPLRLDAKALHRVNNFFIELCATVKDQIDGGRVVGERLAQLLDNPSTARVFGHIAVKNQPPVMRNDEEAVENIESERRYGEEIRRGDSFTMVAEKSRPSPCRLRIARGSSHPAQYGSLRNIEAKHLQFAVNPWCAPGRVVGDHSEDEVAQLLAHALSSHPVPMPREPRPVELESIPMPTNNGLWLDENQHAHPSWPKPAQHHPEEFVKRNKSRLRTLLLENGKLLPKSQVFQKQVAARAKQSSKENSQEPQ